MSHRKKTPTEQKEQHASKAKRMEILTQRILNIMGQKTAPTEDTAANNAKVTKKPKRANPT